MQKAHWSYDLGPWYDGVGAEDFCGLKKSTGGGVTHGCGGATKTESPKATTTSTSPETVMNSLNSKNPNTPLFKTIHDDTNQFSVFSFDESNVDKTYVTTNYKPKVERRIKFGSSGKLVTEKATDQIHLCKTIVAEQT